MSPHPSRPVVARALAVLLTVLLAVTGLSLPASAQDADPAPVATTEPAPVETTAAEPEENAEIADPAEAPPVSADDGGETPAMTEPEASPSEEAAETEKAAETEVGPKMRVSTLAMASTGITASPTTLLDGGDTVRVTGTLPAEIVLDAGASSGTPATTGIYLMFCVEGATAPGSAAGRLTGAACHGTVQQYLVAAPGPAGGTVVGTVDAGVWTFSADLSLPSAFGAHTCRVATGAGEQCGVFVRLYHGFNAGNLSDPYAYDQFVPVSFAPAAGITVSPATQLADGESITVTGGFPASIVQDRGGSAGTPATTGVYVMYCAEGATAPGTAGGRLTGAACQGTVQQYLVSASGPAGGTVVGSVIEDWWTFSTTLSVPDSFGTHECLDVATGGEQCGVFVRLYHGFNAGNLGDPYAYDQFVPVTFAPSAGIAVTPATDLVDGDTVTVQGILPATVVQDRGAASGTPATTGVYLMYCVEGTTVPGSAAGRPTGAACDSSRQLYLAAAAGPAGATVEGEVEDGWWTFEVDLPVADAFGAHECLATAEDAEQCGVFVRLYHGFNVGNLADPYVYDQFVPVTFAAAETETPEVPGDPGTPSTPARVALSVSPSTLNPEVANSITVSGSGYSGAGAANGVYVSLGLTSQWQPGQVPGASEWVRSIHVPTGQVVDGRFSTTITLPAGTLVLGRSYGVATFAAHGLSVTDRTLDAWAPITLSTSAAATATRTTAAPTPPATVGAESEQTEFTEGSAATFTADGFQPNETGILAVIYSEPTVLADDLTADDGGTVSWTGSLPIGLTGEHTFTFQGSVDRGIVIEIAGAEVVGCTVGGAEVDWGVKESFRAYIDGSIANGEWTTADGATYETPLFSWASGTGGYDAETGDADLAFPGSVRFTGHGGALDTTIANPRVVIDGESAVLLLDVSGTTQSGETVAQTGVAFAELDLAAAERGGGGDLVAFTGIPATLTAAGAAAFGTYPEGEALDPVDLRITVDPACVEPAVVVAEEPQAVSESASVASLLPWIIGALALLLLVAALVAFLVRRSRRAA